MIGQSKPRHDFRLPRPGDGPHETAGRKPGRFALGLAMTGLAALPALAALALVLDVGGAYLAKREISDAVRHADREASNSAGGAGSSVAAPLLEERLRIATGGVQPVVTLGGDLRPLRVEVILPTRFLSALGIPRMTVRAAPAIGAIELAG